MAIDNTFSGGLVHIWASEQGGALCGHAEPRAILRVKSVQALNADALQLLCHSCLSLAARTNRTRALDHRRVTDVSKKRPSIGSSTAREIYRAGGPVSAQDRSSTGRTLVLSVSAVYGNIGRSFGTLIRNVLSCTRFL